jgi:hypothetical protein
VALVGEAARRGDLGEREVVSPEQPTREIDATLADVRVRRRAEATTELVQMVLARADDGGELRERWLVRGNPPASTPPVDISCPANTRRLS